MLSVVIPVHNETERIPLFLPKIVTTFSDLDLENEIIKSCLITHEGKIINERIKNLF